MHTLVVGNGSYADEDQFPELHAAEDAEILYKLLTDSSVAIFDRNSSRLAVDVDLEEMLDLTAQLFLQVQRQDLVLLYFAGHARATPGGKRLFLAMRNSDASALAGSAYTVDRFLDHCDEKQLTRYVVMLDCCHAARASESPSARARGSAESLAAPDWCGQGKVFVAAARGHQLAYESEELRHGLFSYYLAEGIRSGEPADPSSRFLSVLDLARYAASRIAQDHPSVYQEPIVSGEDMMGRLPIALNARFRPESKHAAEMVELLRKTLELKDLSDRAEIDAARVGKLRKFMDTLKAKVGDGFRNLREIVVDHGLALGMDETVASREFSESLASMAFAVGADVEYLGTLQSSRGKAFLFSTAFGGTAAEVLDLQSGLFSYHLREALLGKASNRDGVVTLLSAFEYLRVHVEGFEHHAQRPLLVATLSQDVPLATAQGSLLECQGRRVALLVGVNEYQGVPSLQYAETDVDAMSKVLTEHGGFSCHLLRGTAATESAVLQALESIISDLEDEDMFLFYFSGHGYATQEDGFAVLSGSPIPQVEGATPLVSVTRLSQMLDAAGVGVGLAILDTCMAPARVSRQYDTPRIEGPL
jgi:uncharacterized caspase-like protein